MTTYANPFTWQSGAHTHTLSTGEIDGKTEAEIQAIHDAAVSAALLVYPQSQ